LGAFSLGDSQDLTIRKFPGIEVKAPLPQIHLLVLLLTDFLSFEGKPASRVASSLFGVLFDEVLK
jgi:hypothetical protein